MRTYMRPLVCHRVILHCLALLGLFSAVALIAVRMPCTPRIVDCHLAFVIMACILFANYNDWQQWVLGGATSSGHNKTLTRRELTEADAPFDFQRELRLSFSKAVPTSLSDSGHWMLPCAGPQPLDTGSQVYSKRRTELLDWQQRIHQVAVDFDEHMAEDTPLPYEKTLDDGTVLKAPEDGNRYYVSHDGVRVTLSTDNSSIALDLSGNVVRVNSDGDISQHRADGTYTHLSPGGGSMFVSRADGVETEVSFGNSTEPSTIDTPNYKHAHWFLGGDVAPYKVAGDGRSITCIALCKTKPPRNFPTAEELESGASPGSANPNSAEPSTDTVREAVSTNGLASTAAPPNAPKGPSKPVPASATNDSDERCGAWLSDGEKCFLYDRRRLNVSAIVPVCWTADPAPPAPFTRWGAVAANLNGEISGADDGRTATDADGVVALAAQHAWHPAWAWGWWIIRVFCGLAIAFNTLVFFLLIGWDIRYGNYYQTAW